MSTIQANDDLIERNSYADKHRKELILSKLAP